MSDSDPPDHLNGKHDRDREQRVAAIKRWVAYIKAEPPETWGPQQNAVVNDQLDAAQCLQTSAAHQQHVTDVADAIMDERDEAGESTDRRDGEPLTEE